MHTFLAVEPCDYEIRGLYRFATLKDTGLAEALADVWPDQPRLLMVAADPADATTTENLALDLASALTKAGREVGEVRVLEQDTAEHAAPLLAGAHVIVLADGDDEKRAAFYADINLADCLAAVDENVVLIALDAAALTAAGLAVPADRTFG
ncbi:hypothetical protein GKZ27_00540 [Enterorhabdus mucosicola]|uniref:Uncharacterized protein n=1 Tax=Adlercreutzia mucosicola TaxID=580026 RepID=A0A6N8JLN5_9ACTN|nr:hypothetical protein [Adlercreutzia mucosicola]MVX59967.1 hypothetical protein [Adlercreutzia mucosicola]